MTRHAPPVPELLGLTLTVIALGSSACEGTVTSPRGDSASTAALCTNDFETIGPSPLRRLTHQEYDNAVHELVGDTTRPARSFTPETVVGHFTNQTTAQNISPTLGEQYFDSAITLAEDADLGQVVGCDVSSASCVESFIRSFGRRVYRRQLTGGEVAEFVDMVEDIEVDEDAESGVRAVIASMLASPHFLFRPEFGSNVEAPSPATAYELATRLASFLWASIPDEELLDAAEAGELSNVEGIERQARRMIADPRAQPAIEEFYAQWFKLDYLNTATKNAEMFPGFTPEVRSAMREEMSRFVHTVLFEEDARIETMLTAPFGFVNAPLAEFYGVDAPEEVCETVSMPPQTFDWNDEDAFWSGTFEVADQVSGEDGWYVWELAPGRVSAGVVGFDVEVDVDTDSTIAAQVNINDVPLLRDVALSAGANTISGEINSEAGAALKIGINVAPSATESLSFRRLSLRFAGGTGETACTSEFTRVEYDPNERAGIVTMGGIMTMLASTTQSSPVRRGAWVRGRLLCTELVPPAGVETSLPAALEGQSNRELVEAHTNNPACAGCHSQIDDIGFGFESYDSVGRFREMENGVPVDSAGMLTHTDDADGEFNSATELAARLAHSSHVQRCVATEWVHYALGQDGDSQACTVDRLKTVLEETDGNLLELLVALTLTDAFRYYGGGL